MDMLHRYLVVFQPIVVVQLECPGGTLSFAMEFLQVGELGEDDQENSEKVCLEVAEQQLTARRSQSFPMLTGGHQIH